MKPFSKIEAKSILIILIVLSVVVFINMQVSLRRGRDSIRKNDISYIQKALDTYYQKYRVYPKSTDDGRIIGCFNEEVAFDATRLPINVTICEWGKSSFEEIKTMPRDPRADRGTNYRYISNGIGYSFYVALEGKDEAEYTVSVEKQNLQCGNQICNYGRGVNAIKN